MAKKKASNGFPERPETKKVTQESIFGFWNPEKGECAGVLVKKVEGENPYFLVRVWDEVICTDREAGEIVAKRGQLIGMSASAGLRGIEKHVGEFVVVTRGKKKVKAKKPDRKGKIREYWPFVYEVSGQAVDLAASEVDDDTPF